MWSFTMIKFFVTPVIVAIYLNNAHLLQWKQENYHVNNLYKLFCKLFPSEINHAYSSLQSNLTYSCSQLQVKVAFHSLLSDSLGDTFGMRTFELPRQEISQPALQQRSDSSHQEQPDPPTGGPYPTTWTFTNRSLKYSAQLTTCTCSSVQ